jgi:hypothetical protein
MPALTLDSSTIPIAVEGGDDLRWEDLGTEERSVGGELRSGITSLVGRVWEKPMRTPWLPLATAASVEADLATLGRREADGYLLSDVATAVYVRNIGREDHEVRTLARFTFELHRVSPA